MHKRTDRWLSRSAKVSGVGKLILSHDQEAGGSGCGPAEKRQGETMRAIVRVVVVACMMGAGWWLPVMFGRSRARSTTDRSADRATLLDAQRSFYNARYHDAATQLLELRSEEPDDLAAYELRTSALLFQLKAALGRIRPTKRRPSKRVRGART